MPSLSWEMLIYSAIVLVVIIIGWEWMRDKAFREGFTDGVVPEYFGRFFPRRYDIVPGQAREGDGWVRNPRYFEGYVDVQRLGYKGDFCRVVEREDDPDSRVLVCALAGQEGLDSMTYRTESQRGGTRFSRDDYFRDVNDDGREDYGRILKVAPAPGDRWEARVVPAGLTRFKQGSEIPDNSPPPHIADLLWFYEGAMVWYRWIDDMLDYAENTQVRIAGEARVDEKPNPAKAKGLALNKTERLEPVDGAAEVAAPAEQYLKIGETPRLEFDTKVQLRQLRAVSVWAYFEEFSNNARIFDFGNGAGKDNVLFGIEGRGNTQGGPQGGFGKMFAQPPPGAAVCQARAPREVSPQTFLQTSGADVDTWACPGPEPIDSTYPEDEVSTDVDEPRANLLFEIWDTQQRKMQIRVLNCVPRRRWVHLCATTTDAASFRPTWHIYVDGRKVFEEQDGHMPLQSYTTNNYIGRSNWEGVTSQYQDADERFRGALFDFRLYRAPMSAAKIKRTVEWGRAKLGIQAPQE
jgi:hypothetical protein